MKDNTVYIYTDGACRGNPGKGGWGAILCYQESQKQLQGYQTLTTNNQMELIAVIEALSSLKKPSNVTLTTDSQYVKNGITTWLKNWKQKNWQNSQKQTIKNLALWKKLDELLNYHRVICRWVKGHAGHTENELADQLANQAIDQQEKI